MKRYLHFILCCVLTGYAGQIFSDQLIDVKDISLVQLLNDIELVKERRDLPMQIRIFRLKEQGECDGSPQSCPRETFYIAVSSFDESPDQKLYILQKSFGWRFIRWLNWPNSDSADQFILFEVEEKVPSSDLTKSWWSERKYIVRVNIYQASLNMMKGDKVRNDNNRGLTTGVRTQ